MISIHPHQIPSPTAVSVKRTEVRIFAVTDADSQAEIKGQLFDNAGNVIQEISYTMTVAEYNAWGSDDTYPTTLLLQNNGLTAA